MPTGQVMGAQSILSTDSISSSSASALEPPRSSLFTNVMIGVARSCSLQSLIVCASTTLGGVDHHYRASTGRQHPIGVLEKSRGPVCRARLMVWPLRELHDRAGDRDTARFSISSSPTWRDASSCAPLRCRPSGRSAEEQQFFFGDVSCPVRVGNDPNVRRRATSRTRSAGKVVGSSNREQALSARDERHGVRKNKSRGRQGSGGVASPIIPRQTSGGWWCR